MNIGVAPIGEAWVGMGFGPTSVFGDPLEMVGRVADVVTGDPISMQGLLYATYFAVGSTDLTGKLYNLRKSGFGKRIKDHPIPGSRKTIKIHQGVEGPIYTASVAWGTDRNAADAFLQELAGIDNDAKAYLRDSLWYHKVYWAESTPDPQIQTWVWQHDIKLYLTDPYRYSEINQAWDVVADTLPQTSEAMSNYGHVADGFESITITGHHNGTNHVEDLVLSIADGDSMTLSDHLLSDEEITLEVDGTLTTEWTANMSSPILFSRDVYDSSLLAFSANPWVQGTGHCTIKFSGPWPTKRPIKLTATLDGTPPKIEISTDGVTYSEAVLTADIAIGTSAVYWLTGTAKAADIYIRFTSVANPFGFSALKIERELDCSGADLPSVAPGAAKAFTVSCDVTKSTSATIAAEYHPRREAI